MGHAAQQITSGHGFIYTVKDLSPGCSSFVIVISEKSLIRALSDKGGDGIDLRIIAEVHKNMAGKKSSHWCWPH